MFLSISAQEESTPINVAIAIILSVMPRMIFPQFFVILIYSIASIIIQTKTPNIMI